jgi:electron transfer flavoprotein beta subunit
VKIAVCCKAVPGAVSDVEVEADGTALRYRSQVQSMNECDEYGLEAALALKRATGGEIIALTMGPLTAQDILHLALAKGADKAVRIDAKVQDARAASKVLAAALKTLACDLILTGTQSRDSLTSFVGISTAQELGIPFAFAVTAIEMDGPGAVKVRKELGGGRSAELRLQLPALLCVQTGIQPLNYVPPARMLRARQQKLQSLSLEELGLAADQLTPRGYRFASIAPPVRSGRVEWLQGSPGEIATQLLAKLKEVD